MGEWFNLPSIADLIRTTIQLTVPIAFAALGEVLAERSGIFNIGLEGMMLAGAFGAALGVFLTGVPLVGLLTATIIGTMAALILVVLAISLGINQVVCGIAINILSLGLTSFCARLIFGHGTASVTLAGFHAIAIPGLSQIPFLGPVLFNQDPLVYLLYILAPLIYWLLWRTNWGLSVRATGENPAAADTAGVPVFAVRFTCGLISGALAGIGGAYIVLAQVFVFTEHMSAGKGFIALAAVILGRWDPLGAVAAALFFGFCDALQLRLQFANASVPYQIFVALPYAASILVLVGFYGRVKAPASVGLTYRRESR